jgi:predicted dehydrogenase
MRYLAGANPTSVISSETISPLPETSFNSKVDRAVTATLAFPNDIIGTMHGDLMLPPRFGFIPYIPKFNAQVECEGGSVDVFNYLMPTLYHSITVTQKSTKGTETRTEKVYTWADAKLEGKGEDWWTTYRHQLEGFVDKLKGRTPKAWIAAEDSIANMEWIEKIYEKVRTFFTSWPPVELICITQNGLGSRPKSEHKPH